MADLTRVRHTSAALVYTSPGVHPFRNGDEFDVPAEHAAHLVAAGHVEIVTPAAPAAPPAPAQSLDHS